MLAIFFSALLGENIILTKFLGIDTCLNREDKEKNIIGISISLMLVVLISTLFTYLINTYVLIPTSSVELQTLIFILIIICVIQITDIIIKKHFKNIHKFLKVNLPLMAANTALFGIVLSSINMEYDLINSLIYSLASTIGFIFVMYVITNIEHKIRNNDIIKTFKGLPILLITLGIMALIIGRMI